jgi:hypothetical protein
MSANKFTGQVQPQLKGNVRPPLQVNYLGGDWQQVKLWLQSELGYKLSALSSPDCTDDQTKLLRGELRFIRAMLAQEQFAGQAVVAHDPDY